MKKLKIALIAFIALVGIATMTPSYVMADPAGEIQGGINAVGGDNAGPDLGTRIRDIVNILLYLLGAIAVVMIVIGGIRYTTSNGESAAVTSAKNTILYAVIGLVVAILAYAIVNFVVKSF